MKTLLSLAILVLGVGVARAENPITSAMPTGLVGPQPIGLVFPGFNIAAGVNASALAVEKATALQASFSPSTDGLGDNIFGSFATSNKKIGLGGGYLGNRAGGTMTHSAFGGLAYRFEAVTLGAGVRSVGIGGTAVLQADASAMFTGQGGISVGAVGYDLGGSQLVGIGAGVKSKKAYHIEANVLLPLKQTSSTGITAVVAGSMAASIFDIFFNVSYLYKSSTYVQPYPGNPSAFSYTFGAAAWMGHHFNLVLQYSTLPGTTLGRAAVGLTYVM